MFLITLVLGMFDILPNSDTVLIPAVKNIRISSIKLN